MKCPHCQKDFNAGKVMGSAKSPAKQAAAKKRGEFMRKAFANQKKMEGGFSIEGQAKTPLAKYVPVEDLEGFPVKEPEPSLSVKKAAALAALASAPNRQGMSSFVSISDARPMHEIPCAPFDFKDEEGNLHRVKAYGKTLKVCFMRDGVEEPMRNLAAGELESLWLKRIIK